MSDVFVQAERYCPKLQLFFVINDPKSMYNSHQEDVVMKATKMFFPLFLSLALVFSACGGGGVDNSNVVQEADTQAVTEPVQKELSPSEIGNQVGDIYLKAMQDITGLLKDKPEASTMKPRVEGMKEMYVQELVALGKLRKKFSDNEKGIIDSKLSQKVYSAGNQPWYATFNEIQQHYFSDQEFHKLVIGFNIITQYADFELLKKQEPEEAARLGIL
jgi:hypothetical protein